MKPLCLSLSLLVAFFCASCVERVNFDLDIEAGMGISCFLAPHMEEIQVRIFESQAPGTVGGTTPEDFIVSDAEVTLTNLTQNWQLAIPFDPDTTLYLLEAPPDFLRSGDRYQLLVQHQRLPNAAGECVIPAPPEGFEVQIDSVAPSTSPFLSMEFFGKTQWQDFPELNNYYRLVGKIKRTQFDDLEEYVFWEGLEEDPDFISDEIATDGQIVGPIADIQTRSQEYGGSGAFRILHQDSFLVDLLHITEDYHRFHVDLRQARQSPAFLTEPYFIHTNLEGAEGIFTAYAKVSYRIRLR